MKRVITGARHAVEGVLKRRDSSGLYLKTAFHEYFATAFYIDRPSGRFPACLPSL